MNLFGWVTVFITFIISIIGAISLQLEGGDTKKEIGFLQQIRPQSTKQIMYCILMIICNIILAILLCKVYFDNSFLFNLKRLSLISVMWPMAFIDYKNYRIPNKLILLGLGYRGLILIAEIFMERSVVLSTLATEGIAIAALLFVSVLCMLIIKGSLGMGDVKLFVLMGACQGVAGITSSIFLSLLVSLFFAVFLLITKKKSRKDAIPFAPSLLIGTYISIALFGA